MNIFAVMEVAHIKIHIGIRFIRGDIACVLDFVIFDPWLIIV